MRIKFLDGIRGVLALLVLIDHVSGRRSKLIYFTYFYLKTPLAYAGYSPSKPNSRSTSRLQ